MISCNAEKRALNKYEKAKLKLISMGLYQEPKDSTSEITKDSIIYDTIVDPSSYMWMELSFMCDSARESLMYYVNRIETENGNLKFKYDSLSQTMYIGFIHPQTKIIVQHRLHTSMFTSHKTVYVTTNILTPGQRLWVNIGKVFIILSLIIIAIGLVYFFVFKKRW